MVVVSERVSDKTLQLSVRGRKETRVKQRQNREALEASKVTDTYELGFGAFG